MNAASTRSLSPVALFGLLVAALVLAEAWIVCTDAFRRAPDLLALAVAADLVLVPVGLGWALLVRTGRVRATTLWTIAGGGLFVASLLLPRPPRFLSVLRFLPILELLPILAEVGLLVWGVIVGRSFWTELRRRNATSDDVLVNVHEALAATPGLPVALRGMAAEVVVLWYGLCAFRKRATSGPGGFAYHENLTALIVLMFVGTPAEGALMHYLLRQWNATAAWIGTALHVYTLIWGIALYQAARLRPVIVKEDTLLIRWSLLWTAEVPREQVASVTMLKERPARREKGVLDLARLGDKPVRVEFSTPVMVHGPLGLRREVHAVLLAVERPAVFSAQLEAEVA
jgi:hypothetical protein